MAEIVKTSYQMNYSSCSAFLVCNTFSAALFNSPTMYCFCPFLHTTWSVVIGNWNFSIWEHSKALLSYPLWCPLLFCSSFFFCSFVLLNECSGTLIFFSFLKPIDKQNSILYEYFWMSRIKIIRFYKYW